MTDIREIKYKCEECGDSVSTIYYNKEKGKKLCETCEFSDEE